LEDSEDNVPLKELVRKESAQPENVSATETKSYEEYIMKRNERLQTNQEETVKEKSAPKGKDSIAKGKTDPKDKAILDLVDNVYYLTACYATLNFSLLQEERNSNLLYIIR